MRGTWHLTSGRRNPDENPSQKIPLAFQRRRQEKLGMKPELTNKSNASNGTQAFTRPKPGITSTLYLTQTTPRLVLGTTEDARKEGKRVSLIRPAHLPLPYSYCSVEVFREGSGLDVCDPHTKRELCHLGCTFENFEEVWADLLPKFSAAYVEGDSRRPTGRNGKMNDQPTPFDAAHLLRREMGKQRAANYIRAVLEELQEPEEKPRLLDDDELETFQRIAEKVRLASE